jgi:hypothetical protein
MAKQTIKGFVVTLLKSNFKAKLDDEALLAAVVKTFPDRKPKTRRFIVRCRARFNRLTAGAEKLPRFEGGKPLPMWGERRAAKKTPTAKKKAAKK